MKKIILILSVIYSFTSIAQEKLKVNVNDLLTLKPIKSVEVYLESVNEKPIVGMTDKLGQVIFNNLSIC